MSHGYTDHLRIEKKWQDIWFSKKAYKTDIDLLKKKYYILDMFPYPSGDGLHVGHVLGYTCADIVARIKRNEGFNVLHPMGWDSFGLPAEQFAIKTNQHPDIISRINVKKFKEQLNKLGFSYDWDREIMTSDPSYYKWTQFIFTKMYEKGLAYQEDHFVNFCPELGCVLSKEEIDNDGRSKEGNHKVIKVFKKQWVLKITEYADRLLNDLDDLDWPEGIKQQQINWIGRTEGLLLQFKIKQNANVIFNVDYIDIFISNFKTFENSCAVVISGEHKIIREFLLKNEHLIDMLNSEEDIVAIPTNIKIINPINERELPLYISNFEYFDHIKLIHPENSDFDAKFVKKIGKEENVDTETQLDEIEIKKILIESFIGREVIKYKLKDWTFARQRYWGEPIPVLHYENNETRALDLSELPLELPDEPNYQKVQGSLSPLERNEQWINIFDNKKGMFAKRDPNTMPQWAGSCWYYLRFMDPSNDNKIVGHKAESYWNQVDMYIGGSEHAVLHLLYARFWHKFLFDIGIVSNNEPFKKLENQGLIYADAYVDEHGIYYAKHNIVEKNGELKSKLNGRPVKVVHEKMSKSKLNGVSPDDVIVKYGADTLRLYVMFMGPFNQDKKWDSDSIIGCRRALDRLYNKILTVNLSDDEESYYIIMDTAFLMKKFANEMKFNNSVAEIMKMLNKIKEFDTLDKNAIRNFLIIFCAFAPHLASEIWEICNFEGDILDAKMDDYTPQEKEDDIIKIIIQVNGKYKNTILIPKNSDESDVINLIKSNEKLHNKINFDEISDSVFIKNKVINFLI